MIKANELNISDYKNLFIFLKENDLEINNKYNSDLDYKYYQIVKKGSAMLYKTKFKQTDWNITFLFGQECKEFTWKYGFEGENIESMNEDMFLYKLNKIRNKWCKNWDGEIDFNDLNRL